MKWLLFFMDLLLVLTYPKKIAVSVDIDGHLGMLEKCDVIANQKIPDNETVITFQVHFT